MSPFFEPDIPGNTHLTCPAYSFLITHRSTNRKLLFDLGVPKDWTNLAPSVVELIHKIARELKVEKNVADILTEHGIPLKDIEAIIWSHQHFDHIGDPSTFPSSTDVIVGPGFTKAYTPGYPTNPDSTLRDSDFANRTLREVPFDTTTTGLKLGRFDAYDYFGDGSFYLLSTPGHTVGHLCGLARTTTATTTSSSSSFIFMGGDACHLGGEFRPSPYLPLPQTLSNPAQLHPHAFHGTACPGALFQKLHRHQPDAHASATEPFYLVTPHLAEDLAQANWTIDGLKEFDAAEDVFVVLAHDEQLLDLVDFFPATVDGWRAKGYAEKARWRFLGDFEAAVEGVRGSEGKL